MVGALLSGIHLFISFFILLNIRKMNQKTVLLYAVWCVFIAAVSAAGYFYNHKVYATIPYMDYVF